MVALRVAIGWHLCYEGITKLRSHITGQKPFSSEMYLRNSTGPFRHFFHGLVDDFWGLGSLTEGPQVEKWRQQVHRTAEAYGLTAAERTGVDHTLAEVEARFRAYLADPTTKRQIAQYQARVDEWVAEEGKNQPVFEKETLRREQRELDKLRAELTAPVAQGTAEIESALAAATAGHPISRWRQLRLWWQAAGSRERVDAATMGILAVCGAGLVVGLFSRLSALGAAFLLAQFYFSMPPWPGELPNPMAEGNYFIVNKNLIELVALLMLASSPSGRWGGLDALVRALITRPLFGVGADERAVDTDEWET